MLAKLWKFAMIHRNDGNLFDLNEDEIASAACFTCDENVTAMTASFFVASLIENKFLTHEKTIPNWHEHSGQIFAERKRVKEYRDKKKQEEDGSKAKTDGVQNRTKSYTTL
jgi:hypothetical protein